MHYFMGQIYFHAVYYVVVKIVLGLTFLVNTVYIASMGGRMSSHFTKCKTVCGGLGIVTFCQK